MGVHFDGDGVSAEAYGGISRYFTELIEGLGAADDIDVHLPLWMAPDTYFAATFKAYAALCRSLAS